jgi:hypothetical protein
MTPACWRTLIDALPRGPGIWESHLPNLPISPALCNNNLHITLIERAEMVDSFSPQTTDYSAENTDHALKLAARLFAELFWRQCMADQKAQRKVQPKSGKFDRQPTKDL